MTWTPTLTIAVSQKAMSRFASIAIREVESSDLGTFYEHQLDSEAIRMAAFVCEDPKDKAAFDAHWDKILNSSQITKRTIVAEGQVAGHISCYPQGENIEVTYWLGREFWGRGIATEALNRMLELVVDRPIFARAATDNIGSIRVLQKCGFKIIGKNKDFANGRGEDTEEYILRLDRDPANECISMWMTVIFGLVSGVVVVGLMGALLFGCAGRWDLPLFWAYLGVWTVACLIAPLVMDPTLIKERLRPGPGGQDYLTVVAFSPAWLGQHALAGLDVGRFHWSDTVPLAVEILALLAVIAALAVVMWAVAVNHFFSSVIRIQADRGHYLVRSGPYRYVRHPAYAVSPFLLVGAGLALGSWVAALLGVVLVLPILRRTVHEDRVLREQLAGYAAYAEEVRYRLCPGVW